MTHTPIRVLLVDDSHGWLDGLLRLLRAEPGFEVVAVAPQGAGAADSVAALGPDLVVMRGCATEATSATVRDIMGRVPTPILVMTDGDSDADAVSDLDALRAGAMDLYARPRRFPLSAIAHGELIAHLELLASTPAVYRSNRARRKKSPTPLPSQRVSGARTTIGIVASTGGPPVLAELFGALPSSFPVPILLVLHLGSAFVPQFRNWLNDQTPLRAQLAIEGARAEAGTVIIAPADRHLAVAADGSLTLDESPPEDGHRPSGNVLLRSLARHCGRQAVGVVLSGMGTDGGDGLLAVHRAGGATIVQDEASCAVFGMPGHALAIGAASEATPRAELARRLLGLVRHDPLAARSPESGT